MSAESLGRSLRVPATTLSSVKMQLNALYSTAVTESFVARVVHSARHMRFFHGSFSPKAHIHLTPKLSQALRLFHATLRAHTINPTTETPH